MKHIRCIAIDDEPMALEIIEDYLNKFDFIQNQGLFTDAYEAIDFINSNTVDLIFLDIQMPDITGLQFLEKLNEPKLTILTTAYDDYAMRGYDIGVIDYLLKPISPERFEKAVARAYQFYLNNEVTVLNQLIEIKSGYDKVNIKLVNLFFIEGNGNYLNFYTTDGKILSLMKMEEILKVLPKNFKRIHKSYIININHITVQSSKEVTIMGHKIPISKSYKLD